VASGLMPAAAPPSPALAAAVRAANWAEVRALTADAAPGLSPVVALVAARAQRALGDPARGLGLIRRALPGAGELSAALRLEAAEAAVELGEDPWSFLAPLFSRSSPPAQRRAAAAVLRGAAQTLPLPVLERTTREALPSSLRRDLAATLAVRGGDEALALHVLAEHANDEPSLRAARWLAGRRDLAPTTRLAVAEALLAGGAWQRADELLLALPVPSEPRARFRWAYVRGRAAYRLGQLGRAGEAFGQALALAGSEAERFTAAVQCARVAELGGDLSAALGFWDTARAAQPREVEGWDGSTRLRAVLGERGQALGVLAGCPRALLRVVGPRLAATLLLHADTRHARAVLARLPGRIPVVRALLVAVAVREGGVAAARATAAALLADPHGGPWREQVLDLLPSPPDDGTQPAATRDPLALARIAVQRGAPTARRALAKALAADPAWVAVLDNAPEAGSWNGPAATLAAVGLEREAAALYPRAFPETSPGQLAWSARTLAAWGNSPAALAAGERLWAELGPLPAVLLPEAALPAILPPQLASGCVAAARELAVPPPWLVAIVRQESRFDAGAFSTSGAIGIAQLVPDTARRLGASPAELRDAERSLMLAAREVARLAGRFGGRLAPVAASYNAGEAVVSSWLAELGDDPGGVLFTAAVPYRETAGYVLAVREGAVLARYLK
jgi:soluble lytic murein transglycosylase-like protein